MIALEDRPGEPLVELRLAVAALPGDTVLLCEQPLPERLFIGLLDRGSASEEKVLCYAKGKVAYVQVRGFDGTRAFAHFPWDPAALQVASNMAVQMQRLFGPIPLPRPAREKIRLAEMEELVFAPVYEWVAEGEARAVREFELA